MVKEIEEMSTNQVVNNLRTEAEIFAYQYIFSIFFMAHRRTSKNYYYVPHEKKLF